MKSLIIVLMIAALIILAGCQTAVENKEDMMDDSMDDHMADDVMEDTGDAMGETGEVMDDEMMEGATHTVTINENGFSPQDLTVKAGDTVVWENSRSTGITKALVAGTMACVKIKSPILESGETFEHTFDEAGGCTFVEAITTTQTGTVTVE